MIIEEIVEWNEVRDNMEYNPELEFNMLAEEVNEYLMSKQVAMLEWAGKHDLDPYDPESFEAMTEEQLEDFDLMCKVNEADALADIIFVAAGALGKLTGDKDKARGIVEAVISANNLKEDKKDANGKIQKKPTFVGPESIIRGILTS